MRRTRILARLLAFIIFFPPFAWISGLLWFESQIEKTADQEILQTDAIVVLTGGTDRIQEGLRLLKRGAAGGMLISGVGKIGTDKTEIILQNGVSVSDLSILENYIELGYTAKDTQGNAEETIRWMQQKNYNSLRLVTSNYHMPRALLEFKRMMPGYTIIPHPVSSPNVKLGQWWKYKGTRDLIISEYDKYLGVLFHKLTGY